MITIDIREHNKLNGEYSAYVSFNYNAIIVNAMRELPFKFYNPDNKTWEIPVNKVKSFIEKMNGMFQINITGKTDELEEKQELNLPKSFEFKTKPYKHQKESLLFGLKMNCWFLGDDMGLGKSKQTIDIAVARKLLYGYKHCLIICGVNTLKWNWVNEIHTHSNENAYILGQRRKNNKLAVGSTNDKINDLKNLKSIDSYFLITNVESFRNNEFAETIKMLCNNNEINMCVADEIHRMKNPSSQQSKGFLKCLPQCRIAMTGTPVMNNPLDLYIILRWLGYESHAFYSFKNHYCVMGGFGGYEVIGYKNMDQLTTQIKEIMLRRLKQDILDLPEKTYVDEYVEMSSEQSKIYAEVETDIKNNIDKIKFDTNPLSVLIRLRQATGYTGILSSTVQVSAKLDRMMDLVEEAVSSDNKVIIFSNWTSMTSIINEKLKSYNPALITGETKDNERTVQQDKFMNDKNCKVIIGTIGALGTGLTLTAAHTIIFVDEPWNKALFDQAVDRAHRIGTTGNVTIYSIMCKDTIDCQIHELIKRKGALSDSIIDNKKMNNVELLEFLLS